MSILKKASEILVECGYAERWFNERFQETPFYNLHVENNGILGSEMCDPFTDTLEGRRQANAIEDYLGENYTSLAVDSRASKCK